MKLKNLREEYLNTSIQHFDQVILDFEKELLESDDEYVREIIIDSIDHWKSSRNDYLKMK